MIYTLTLNPSIDYIMELTTLTPGTMNRASKTHMYPGGKGINVSVILDALGMENTMLGFVAGFTGDMIEKSLRAEGHRTDFIHLASGISRINVKVEGSVSTEINAPGPTIAKSELNRLFEQLKSLQSGDVLVMSGAIPQGLPEFIYRYILEEIKDKDIITVVDTTGDDLLSTLSCHPFLIKPNRQELESLFSTKILLHTDVDKYAHKLQELGARNVLVSLDREGAVLLTEDGSILYHEAPEGEVVSPVGAGDSMLAGFIYGWLKKHDYNDSLITGIASGSASAFSSGLASKDDILTLKRLL